MNQFRMIHQHGFLREEFIAQFARVSDAAVGRLRVAFHRVARFEHALAMTARKSHSNVFALMVLLPSVKVSIFG